MWKLDPPRARSIGFVFFFLRKKWLSLFSFFGLREKRRHVELRPSAWNRNRKVVKSSQVSIWTSWVTSFLPSFTALANSELLTRKSEPGTGTPMAVLITRHSKPYVGTQHSEQQGEFLSLSTGTRLSSFFLTNCPANNLQKASQLPKPSQPAWPACLSVSFNSSTPSLKISSLRLAVECFVSHWSYWRECKLWKKGSKLSFLVCPCEVR